MLSLTKISETAQTVTLGWTPVSGAVGYRFTAENQAKPSHTWNAQASSVKFSKGSAWYKVEALGVEESDTWPDATPPPPPPPTGGTPIEHFSDVVSANWGQPYINRWYRSGGNAYQPPPSSGNWPSISAEAIEEISTPHGPGFRFRIHAEMLGGTTGAKQVMLHDQNHYIPHSGWLGTKTELTFKIMFPSAGNQAVFYNPGYDDWNALMEVIGDTHVHNQIGINSQGKFYCRSWGHIHGDKAVGPQINRDQWYTHRWIKKWSYDADGLTQWYVDGTKYADWAGPSIEPGKKVSSFQWGYYSATPPTLTEVHYAGMRFINH